MNIESAAAFVDIVSHQLLENFVAHLSDLHEKKNYAIHVENVAEIVEWSWEFYDNYYPAINNWAAFEQSPENIFQSTSQEEFIMAFGYARFVKFALNKTSQSITG